MKAQECSSNREGHEEGRGLSPCLSLKSPMSGEAFAIRKKHHAVPQAWLFLCFQDRCRALRVA